MKPRFSERIGAVKVEIQIGTMNDRLKYGIWNLVDELIPSMNTFEKQHREVIDLIARDVLGVPIQHVSYGYPIGWLLEQVHKLTWHEMYDLLEYVVELVAATKMMLIRRPDATQQANAVLARENSGYRFVNGVLAPITSSAEISEIEQAAERATATGLDGARTHIAQALQLFGQRPEPDYRNTVKEAISAVESVVKLVNGTRGGGLREALDAVSAKIEMHQALKTGLDKLYGYTSDEDGVRHAILDEENVDEADARFMIVTCSAFVNFLIVKAEAAGLLKGRL